MPTENERFPKPYLTGADVKNGRDSFVIKRISTEKIGPQDDDILALWFSNEDKYMRLNVTNYRLLASVYGEDDAYWVGKPIKLMTEPKIFNKVQYDAIVVNVNALAEGQPVADENPIAA